MLVDLYSSDTHGIPFFPSSNALPSLIIQEDLDWTQWPLPTFYQVEVFVISLSSSVYPVLASSIVSLNSTIELPLDLTALPPSIDAYTLSCSLSLPLQDPFNDTWRTQVNETFRVLPAENPWGGSVSRIDRRTGAILVLKEERWDPIFPVGFYTSYEDYLAQDISHLDEMKRLGSVCSYASNMTTVWCCFNQIFELSDLILYTRFPRSTI